MVELTKEERCKFLMGFHRKRVIVELDGVQKQGVLANIFLPFWGVDRIKGYQHREIGVYLDDLTKVGAMGNVHHSIRYYSCGNVFPILRPFSKISESELDTVSNMVFSFDNFDIENANSSQIAYLDSILIDRPMWFGLDHDNNGETALDLGIAKEIE